MEDDQERQQQLVCVTGAGGFIGSWLVKELLRRGYHVRGTSRDPADHKNSHLLALEGAEMLSLCRADLLNHEDLRAAFSGCHGVFHVASPITNDDPVELMPAAVQGTRNVMNAAADVGVRRVVFTSSYGAVHMNPNRSPEVVVDETCWSDYNFCKRTGNLYCCAKMMAEVAATEEAARRGLAVVVVVPSLTIGPALQQRLNLGFTHVIHYLTGAYTDVRDVARAHALVYERRPNAPRSRYRYLCVGAVLHREHLVQLLRDLFPQYPVTARCQDDGKPLVKPYKFSNQKLKDTLYDTVVSLQQQGHLHLPDPRSERPRL